MAKLNRMKLMMRDWGRHTGLHLPYRLFSVKPLPSLASMLKRNRRHAELCAVLRHLPSSPFLLMDVMGADTVASPSLVASHQRKNLRLEGEEEGEGRDLGSM